MREIKNIPNWDVFMSTAMAEKPTQISDELYCMIFDYNDFEKDISNNWNDLDTYLSHTMYNKSESSIDFLLNLFKTVITEHKVEKYKNEELRDIRLEFHNERLTQFIGWAKYHFEMMVQEINKKSKTPTSISSINAPVIRRFCELCNNSGLDRRDLDESAENYCIRICSRFKLKYSKNVRTYFDNNNKPRLNDKHLKKVIELILPNIKDVDRDVIDNYIQL